MNNTTKILFHNISWFLHNGNQKYIEESWEEEIKRFINDGYREGEFNILNSNDKEDFLTWRIV